MCAPMYTLGDLNKNSSNLETIQKSINNEIEFLTNTCLNNDIFWHNGSKQTKILFNSMDTSHKYKKQQQNTEKYHHLDLNHITSKILFQNACLARKIFFKGLKTVITKVNERLLLHWGRAQQWLHLGGTPGEPLECEQSSIFWLRQWLYGFWFIVKSVAYIFCLFTRNFKNCHVLKWLSSPFACGGSVSAYWTYSPGP